MNFNVPPDYQIQSTRKSSIASKKTINGYDRDVAIDNLQKELLRGSVPESNCWAVELCISGLYDHLWATLIAFFFKQVNYHRPGLLSHLHQQHDSYQTIRKSYTGHLPDLCNNQELRNHLAELITLLCLTTKKEVEIPTQPSDFDVSDEILLKTHKLVTIFIKDVPKQSTLYQCFFQFVVNYYSSKIENCFYYLDWFAKDIDYVVSVDLGFKIPSLITNRSCLLIFKFLFLQIQTQLKVDGSYDVDEVTDHLDTIFEVYLLTYKRRDLVTCTNILVYLLVMSRCLEHFIPLSPIDTSNPVVIQQCLEINLLYKTIRDSPHPTTGTSKGKKKSTPQFYDDPRNQEYVNIIHNHDLLKEPGMSDENVVTCDNNCGGDSIGSGAGISGDRTDTMCGNVIDGSGTKRGEDDTESGDDGTESGDDGTGSDWSDGSDDNIEESPPQDITVVLCE